MKALIPSHKENKRYLKISGKYLKKNVEKAILEFVGTLGFSKVGLSFIKSGENWAIICINREEINNVRGSFAIYPEKISVEKVSGTLKVLGK
ncbi:hypothetical protein HOD88_03280 [archaeon]|jgi:RNase P/RNase MRP subunit POP5|nr:hypothetical protein [archaeon]